jgi:glycosyltransferase involved in cell wall biosynthesis
LFQIRITPIKITVQIYSSLFKPNFFLLSNVRMGKKIFVLVSNDIATDNRVHRTCTLLTEIGFQVVLVGRSRKTSIPLEKRNYECRRLNLVFEKGPLFYAALNLRFFLMLLLESWDGIYINDLDTLPAGYYASKLKGKKSVIYDSHELFTETPELEHRKSIKKVWLFFEKNILPKIQFFITVNDSIATVFQNSYDLKAVVVRNVPNQLPLEFVPKSKIELGIPEGKPLVIIQGSGMNVDRGIEESIMAMKNVDAILLLVGSGDVIPNAKKMVEDLGLKNRVLFFGKRPYLELMSFTVHADIGLAVDKPISKNYELALPNKLFDYIQASTPIICSQLIEIKKVVEHYNVGISIPSTTPENISHAINSLLNDRTLLNEMKRNCKKAAEIENWGKENEKLRKVIKDAFGNP